MTKGGLVGERLRGYGIRMGAYMMRPTPSAPMAKREGGRDGPLWPKVGGMHGQKAFGHPFGHPRRGGRLPFGLRVRAAGPSLRP
jgi:hypothetical protein